jgi:hypothetical protein
MYCPRLIRRARHLIRGSVVGACVLAAACATSEPGGERQSVRTGSASECFFSRGARDFTHLDDQNLIVYGVGRDAYQIELVTPSMNLRSEFRLGILDRDGDGRICPYGRDVLLVDGPLAERIQIRSIRHLTPEDVEAVKVEYGIIEPAEGTVTVTEVEPSQ